MARCPHNRVGDYTETCIDCGRNIWETDEEYLRYLKELKQESEIERLEIELGIRHPGNTPKADAED